MKLDKFILGLGGIMALTLTGCHDEPEYEPAPQPVTPPAYFNLSDEQVIDLEEDSKDFLVPLYRANGGAAQTVTVTSTVKAEDGVNANVFDIPQTVTFEEGMTRADMVIKLDMADIVPLKQYDFTFKVDGESNPYLLTDVAYEVMYTPWETVVSPEGNDIATLINDGLLTSQLEMECMVQEQPSKPGFFRVRHPYINMPAIQGSTQLYPDSDPLWLYINATNNRAAFFSDSRGKNPELYYATGVSVDGMGELTLICAYTSYLTGKNIVLPGSSDAYDYSQFASYAGSYSNGLISWGDKMIHSFNPTMYAEGALYSNQKWEIQLPTYEAPKEWESMGTALVQEGFLSNYFAEAVDNYTVAIEQNIANKNLIRMVNPYAMGVFPGGTLAPTRPVYLVFDCTDPDCVLMDLQSMGYEDPDNHWALRACNLAALYYFGRLTDDKGNQLQMTIDEIKKEGICDTYKDYVITINYPVIVEPSGDLINLAFDDEAPASWKFRPEIITINPNVQPMVVPMTNSKPKLRSGRLQLTPANFTFQGKLKFGHRNR